MTSSGMVGDPTNAGDGVLALLEGGLDTSGFVRRARRLADLSQRELAERIGAKQPRVSAIEGGADLSVQMFMGILATAGLRLTVVDVEGNPVEPMPDDVFHDRAGRRRPAHLDVHARPENPTMKMLLRAADPVPPGGAWHHLREERDRLRRTTGGDAVREQLTSSVARARRAEAQRRRPRARPPDASLPGGRVVP
ncbi:helix-turn-helix domain-containing protein [Microbacterium sp. KR10-403]|uniref:XRE family transcriptional regulator n=1 Tax=Microbacterium sp. KR10-403 TaxID=3158581 RepID=UPI0032E41E2C